MNLKTTLPQYLQQNLISSGNWSMIRYLLFHWRDPAFPAQHEWAAAAVQLCPSSLHPCQSAMKPSRCSSTQSSSTIYSLPLTIRDPSLSPTQFCMQLHTYVHPFNGPLSRNTRVSQYQKGKNHLDFTEARDSEWQWHQLGHMQVCTSLQTNNHASTPPLSFLQAGCSSCRPINSVKALKAQLKTVMFSRA